MNASLSPTAPWQDVIAYKARLLYQQIAATQRLFAESGRDDDALLNEACKPYYKLLDTLYRDEMPLAGAIDDSDLLLHLDGEAVAVPRPRLSLVAGVFGDVRKQVGGMIKVLAGALDNELTLPKEIDLGLASFARGSLYLGFTLPEPGPGQTFLPGDPLVTASREALETLGAITGELDAERPLEAIRERFPDPMIRDAGLAAVSRLAPSGRRGIESIGITGRVMADRKWRTLTPLTRERVRTWLEQPVLGEELVIYEGTVREIDLDARRVDLRQLAGSGNDQLAGLRCIYPATYDKPAKTWLDRRLHVTGRVETYRGRPRLMQVETAEAL